VRVRRGVCRTAEREGLFAEFLQAWDSFMANYGFRCPMEMDPPHRALRMPGPVLRATAGDGRKHRRDAQPQAAYEQVRPGASRRTQNCSISPVKKGGARRGSSKRTIASWWNWVA